MKISVVVPVYNTSKYLYQCLNSLKEQTLKDIEVICVNDGSTDESLDIIMSFVNSDERFSVVNKENTGYGNSMNIGMRKAAGEYIGILESDDFAEPDMFEKLSAVADKYYPDIVKGNFYECDRFDNCQYLNNLEKVPYNQMIDAQKYPKIFCMHPSIWTAIYKKSFLEEQEVSFLETPGASFQDISFSFKALFCAASIVCIPDAVMNYRVENYGSSIYDPEKSFCVCDELDEMKRFLEKKYQSHKIDDKKYSSGKEAIDWLLYVNYIWNYKRLSMPFKYAFLMKTKEAFVAMPEQTFKCELWTKEDLGVVNEVVETMNSFFKWNSEKIWDTRYDFFNLLNKKFYEKGFWACINECEKIAIYGAGKTGKKFYQILKGKNLSEKVNHFVVSSEGKEHQIEDINIVTIDKLLEEEKQECLFIVAVLPKHQLDILHTLEVHGIDNVILLNDVVEEFVFEK